MTKRKPSPRLPRERGTVFLAALTPDAQVLGIMQNRTTISFFNHFTADPDAPVNLDDPGEVLFTASVWKGFFQSAPVWRIDRGREDLLAAIPLPDRVIRIRPRLAPGGFPDAGGDLYLLRDPLFPDTSSKGTLLKADLRCETDREAIESYELSVVQTSFPLRERLEACRLSGRNVDPYKARVFDGCDFLKNEYVLQTHFHSRDGSTLPGLLR